MRFFFRSRQFKIILSVFCAVVLLTVIFAFNGSRMSPTTDIAGVLTAPVRSAVTFVSQSVKDFFGAISDGNDTILKNKELEKEIDALRNQLVEYDEIKAQNDFYKNYLGIKDEHPDFAFSKASLVSKDPDDPYGGFVINKGSASGIKKYDPVITEAGLIGYISNVGVTTSKVTTILSPDITLGALDNRTSDSGVIGGTLKLAEQGKCVFRNLSRSCSVAIGDYVVTSGEGIFPAGLLVGTIDVIDSDKYNTSIYAEITPFVDMQNIKDVMVITNFNGKGGINPGAKGD